MSFTITQVCVLLSALYTLVRSQAPGTGILDPNVFGNPFNNLPVGGGQPLDPNFFPPTQGGFPNDPNMFPNPNQPPIFSTTGVQQMPRPNPMASMLPYLFMRGADISPWLMYMLLGQGGAGGGMLNPLLMMKMFS